VNDTQFEFVLLPTRRDVTTTTLTIAPAEWRSALALSRKFGYSPPDCAGLSRDAVRWFTRSLQKALEGIKEAAVCNLVERILKFCQGDGAVGFTLERRWKRAV